MIVRDFKVSTAQGPDLWIMAKATVSIILTGAIQFGHPITALSSREQLPLGGQLIRNCVAIRHFGNTGAPTMTLTAIATDAPVTRLARWWEAL